MAIEREEIERLAKDRDDEQAILDRNVYGRLAEMLLGKMAVAGPKNFKKNQEVTGDVLNEFPRSQWWQIAVEDEKLMSEVEALRGQYDESRKRLEQRLDLWHRHEPSHRPRLEQVVHEALRCEGVLRGRVPVARALEAVRYLLLVHELKRAAELSLTLLRGEQLLEHRSQRARLTQLQGEAER